AADHGYAEAQSMMAIRLIKGIGVPRDPERAIRLLRQAAEHGYAKAQNDLGYVLETGEVADADLVEACMWYQLAVNRGIRQAKVNFARLSTRLSIQQYQEVLRRVQDFRPKPAPQLN